MKHRIIPWSSVLIHGPGELMKGWVGDTYNTLGFSLSLLLTVSIETLTPWLCVPT